MPAERYYIDRPLQKEEEFSLTDVEFHHLIHVMRTKENEEVEIINGNGELAKATVQKIEKKQAILHIDDVFREKPSSTSLILAQAIPRINRLETILEKSTELGVTEIWLFPSAKSEKRTFTPHQIERLEAIIIAAMKQCGRLFSPKLLFMPAIKEWKEIPQPAYFGDTLAAAPLFLDLWHPKTDKKSVFFCIGPESGLSDEEVLMLQAKGVVGVKLHTNILRTDTAALAALSLASHLMSL